MVKAESPRKNAPPEFQNTKLMIHITCYTLDEIMGPFEGQSRIDYTVITIQLFSGEHNVVFLFTIKQLVTSGKLDNFSNKIFVPSYEVHLSLTQRAGGSISYDNVVALPTGGRGDKEDF
ncbi:hypothetical protein M9H77_07270 [Catharanthus roseus]|uniref:Uncharacterized protein n=1 Tax=Catharanthus roseus TaxID=4058 RepID=A0ACC0BUM1_CATRO|nr:hypothetical protein M9H77_07270 [Catharanthus roseus]